MSTSFSSRRLRSAALLVCAAALLTSRPAVPSAAAQGPAPALAAPAAASALPEGQIAQQYARLDNAMRAKDARAVGRHLAGDYISTARDGTRTTRAEVKRAMPAIFRSLTAVDHRSRVLKLTMTTPAVAWARVRADSTLRVEQPGQDLLVISQTVFEDQWVRTTAGWRLRRSRAVSVTEAATLNGRPFVLTGPVARG